MFSPPVRNPKTGVGSRLKIIYQFYYSTNLRYKKYLRLVSFAAGRIRLDTGLFFPYN